MDFLCQQINAKGLLRALDRIKSSCTGKQPLNPTYERAMDTIRRQDESSADLALNILSWLVKARRTLTVEELQVALAVEQGYYELDELNLVDRMTLVDVCASLVVIDDMSNTIRLAHYTVQEYLVDKSIIPADADFRVAMCCTTYLSFDVFTHHCTSYDAMLERLQLYLFLDYAACHFKVHLQACEEDLTTDMFLRFLENPGSINSYLQVLKFDRRLKQSWNRFQKKNKHHTLPLPSGKRQPSVYYLTEGRASLL